MLILFDCRMAFINACIADSCAPYRDVKSVQFGILSPDEIVGGVFVFEAV